MFIKLDKNKLNTNERLIRFIMGAEQSKPSQLAAENLIVERLKALQLKHQVTDDGEYICIDNNEKRTTKYLSKSPSLSISTVEEWQHELLQDPKNRSAPPFRRINFTPLTPVEQTSSLSSQLCRSKGNPHFSNC